MIVAEATSFVGNPVYSGLLDFFMVCPNCFIYLGLSDFSMGCHKLFYIFRVTGHFNFCPNCLVCSGLSDFSMFARTVWSDEIQARAIFDILKHFKLSSFKVLTYMNTNCETVPLNFIEGGRNHPVRSVYLYKTAVFS